MAHEDDLNEDDPQVDPADNEGSASPEDQGSEQNPIPPLPTAGESDPNVSSGSGSSEVVSDDYGIEDNPSDDSEVVFDDYGIEDNPSDDSVADANELDDSGFDETEAASTAFPNTLAPDSAIRPVEFVEKDDSISDQVKGSPVPNEPKKPIRSVPSLDSPSRQKDAANLGPMSFYKRKNIDKGRGDNIPGLEKDKDGNYRQTGKLDSGQERDEEGLRQQRELDLDQDVPQSVGPLGIDLQPDIIPDVGFDGASSFRPDGQDSTQVLNDVQSAADAVDTLTTGLLNVLARLTLNMKKANDNIRQLMDKLEVEDHRDEF